jgi:peptidoglycan/LPS O-acetylase OafA/YrhL
METAVRQESDDPWRRSSVESDALGADEARMPHLRALDGLRGIAVLAVVAFHFAPETFPGGFLGVDVFFVLSGFLITSLLVTERERSGRIALGAFWVRRARRLLPALLLVLLAVGLYGVVVAQPFEAGRLRDDGFAALGYFANWHFISSGQSYIADFVGVGPSPLRHTWSLAIEEQFYLLWPLVVAGLGVLVARRAVDLRRALVTGCLVFAVVSVALMIFLYHPGDDPSRVYYGTDTRAHLLLVGGALGGLTAGVVRVRTNRRRRLLHVAGGLAAAALAALVFTVADTSDWLYEGGYALVALMVVLVIAGSAQPGDHVLGRTLGVAPLVGLGLISYGVYLWHWPVFLWVDTTATGLDGVALFAVRCAVTLTVALASFHLVERPIRSGALRRMGPWVPRFAAPVAVVLAVAVLVAPVAAARAPAPPIEIAIGPSTEVPTVSDEYARVPTCNRPVRPQPVRAEVLLIGNSVADEIDECLGEVLSAGGFRLRSEAQAGEALCDVLPRLTREVRDGDRPKYVVIYALKAGYSICWARHGTAEPAVTDTWMQDVSLVLGLYLDAGSHVFLVPPAPKAGTTGEDVLAPRFAQLAAAFPGRVDVLDAHRFIRDRTGAYQMWVPCVAVGEPGCNGGAVQVRLALDGGSHFCAAADHGAPAEGACPPGDAGGVRRVAAGFAAALLPAVDALRAPGGNSTPTPTPIG